MSNGARLDLFLAECLGQLCKTTIEPRCQNLPLWDGGLREIALAKLHEMGVPSQPIQAVDLARMIGLLGPDPNVIEVRSNPGRRVPRV